MNKSQLQKELVELEERAETWRANDGGLTMYALDTLMMIRRAWEALESTASLKELQKDAENLEDYLYGPEPYKNEGDWMILEALELRIKELSA